PAWHAHGVLLEPHPLRGGSAVRACHRDRARAPARRGDAAGAERAARRPAAGRAPCRWSGRRGGAGAGGRTGGGVGGALRRGVRDRGGRRGGCRPRRGRGAPALRLGVARAAPGARRPGGRLPPAGARRGGPAVTVLALVRKELALYFTSFLFYGLATV